MISQKINGEFHTCVALKRLYWRIGFVLDCGAFAPQDTSTANQTPVNREII